MKPAPADAPASTSRPSSAGGHGSVVVVYKKHRASHDEHHGGAWKVAYADLVTALMALFLVLWLVNQTPEVKRNVAGYFRDPGGYAKGPGGAGLLEGGTSLLEGAGPRPKIPGSPNADPDVTAAREALRREAEKIQQLLATLPGLGALAEQIDVELTPEGLRIHLMDSDNASFFDVGSAAPSENGNRAIATIAEWLEPTPYRVVLEGHTDNRPYSERRDYTNWELSADRANTARRILEQEGIERSRIDAIRGFADTRPRFADHPEDPRNRRVSVLVLQPEGKEDEVGEASVPPTAGASG